MSRKPRWMTFVLTICAGACNDEGSGATFGMVTATTDATTAATGDTSTESSAEGVLDLPPGDGTAETGLDEGCQKIDFLFVVDNSTSMWEEQTQLASAFPAFISTIQAVVEVDDYHIMIVDTDEHRAGVVAGGNPGECATWCPACTVPPSTTGCMCDGMWCPEDDECDVTLGAGIRWDNARATCGFDTDDRYMLGTQAGLDTAFTCAAQVGSNGNVSELQVDAMLSALGPLSEPGGCNAGFMRDDALLVVTIISDEDDEFSAGTPADWYDALVALKGGDDTAVVMLGLLNDSQQAGGICADPWVISSGLIELAELLPNGSWASVCETDYAPFFDASVAQIDTSCDEFVPVD